MEDQNGPLLGAKRAKPEHRVKHKAAKKEKISPVPNVRETTSEPKLTLIKRKSLRLRTVLKGDSKAMVVTVGTMIAAVILWLTVERVHISAMDIITSAEPRTPWGWCLYKSFLDASFVTSFILYLPFILADEFEQSNKETAIYTAKAFGLSWLLSFSGYLLAEDQQLAAFAGPRIIMRLPAPVAFLILFVRLAAPDRRPSTKPRLVLAVLAAVQLYFLQFYAGYILGRGPEIATESALHTVSLTWARIIRVGYLCLCFATAGLAFKEWASYRRFDLKQAKLIANTGDDDDSNMPPYLDERDPSDTFIILFAILYVTHLMWGANSSALLLDTVRSIFEGGFQSQVLPAPGRTLLLMAFAVVAQGIIGAFARNVLVPMFLRHREADRRRTIAVVLTPLFVGEVIFSYVSSRSHIGLDYLAGVPCGSVREPDSHRCHPIS